MNWKCNWLGQNVIDSSYINFESDKTDGNVNLPKENSS